MEILIRSFDWENLSKMGRFYGLTGRLGEMKRNRRSSRRTGRVSRTVLDSELKLYLLISILNVISRDANFEKLNTGKMWYQIFLYFSLTDNRCFQELSSAEECWKEFFSLSRLLTAFVYKNDRYEGSHVD